MSHRFWLLVEWSDDTKVVPSYSVIRNTAILNDNTELSIGKYVMVENHDSRGRIALRAKVLKISGSRSSLECQRLLLEKQDLQMQNALSMFMRTVTEMKSQSLLNSPEPGSQSFPTSTPIIPRDSDDSSSDEEAENHSLPHWNQRPTSKLRYNHNRRPKQKRLPFNRPTFNSTQPQQQRTVTYCDKGTQIDNSLLDPCPVLERLEGIVKEIYTRFQMFVLRVDQQKNSSVVKQIEAKQAVNGRQNRNKVEEVKASNIRSIASEILNNTVESIGPVKGELTTRALNRTPTVRQYQKTKNIEPDVKDVEMPSTSMQLVPANSPKEAPLVKKLGITKNNNAVGRTEVEKPLVPANSHKEAPLVKNPGITKNNNAVVRNEVEKPSSNMQPIPVNPQTEAPLVKKPSATKNNNAIVRNEVEMVPIGSGHTLVPARILKDIDWNSHGQATRLLLQAVFPRKVLATHSLTGKRSPAFPGSTPKKQLDPQIIDDIVNTVATRCQVSKRLVRASITIKCTDECKLYRNRLEIRQKRFSTLENQENLAPPPPPPPSITPLPPLLPPMTTSDDSSNELAIYY